MDQWEWSVKTNRDISVSRYPPWLLQAQVRPAIPSLGYAAGARSNLSQVVSVISRHADSAADNSHRRDKATGKGK